jgi:hypothetical protein
MTTTEILRSAKILREWVGITQEEMFWLRVDLGMEFLKTYFPAEAEEFAKQKGFWDLWVYEWIKDDIAVLRGFPEAENDASLYAQLKRGMDDMVILRQLNLYVG